MIRQKKRDIAYLKRTLNIPPNADPNQYCKTYLDNLITQQVEDEMNKEMDDVLGITMQRKLAETQKPISDKYDLGNWSNPLNN